MKGTGELKKKALYELRDDERIGGSRENCGRKF